MMAKRNGDNDREQQREEGREQLTLQQNKYNPHRPLSNCISLDYQVKFCYLFILSLFYLNIFFKLRSIKILDVKQQTIMIIIILQLFFHLNVIPYI